MNTLLTAGVSFSDHRQHPGCKCRRRITSEAHDHTFRQTGRMVPSLLSNFLCDCGWIYHPNYLRSTCA